MNLSLKEFNHYLNLKKGFEGELLFDEWLGNLDDEFLIMNDLLLECNNNLFQLDSVLIAKDRVYIFEVKNYEGDYYIDEERWYSISGTEITDPLLQLKRSETLFRRLLQNAGFNFSIESYIVFVNPEFYLYQAPLKKPFIFQSQINKFMSQLNKTSTNLAEKHKKLTDHLLSIHQSDSPYKRLPYYNFEKLKKGIICNRCNNIMTDLTIKKVICKECGCEENITSAVLRSVEEFRLLFPDKKITTTSIIEWCKIIKSRKTMWKILSLNFKKVGCSSSAYYIDK